MLSSEIRERYLKFFEDRHSKRMPSSSLIPDDPSMLLTSAGMVQFKPYFLQQKHLESEYVGATTVQKCLRTTDIENIGRTGRHLSFFEMLGNFSFGSYFKEEMCKWALEFSIEELGLDKDKIHISIYLDDDECYEIWRNLGIDETHIVRLGEDDNFWTAGPTGPCGPCSELYFDQGETFGCDREDCAPGCDCDRYLEYWNLVFTQYDRQEDGSLKPLPKKNIDTGMGLERVAAMLQGKANNFESDILRGLIDLAASVTAKEYGTDAKTDISLKIIADHSRAVTFMIADGILPSNEGRGYILRRLLRRAVRHGALLGVNGLFLKDFAEVVMKEMGSVYPEIIENKELITKVIESEEEKFLNTLATGEAYLDGEIEALKSGEALSGEAAFKLHDTYGFPYEITVEICEERGIEVDELGFLREMEAQRQRARRHAKDDAWSTFTDTYSGIVKNHGKTNFVGYDRYVAKGKVLAIIADGKQVQSAEAGSVVELILDTTPFYGELGGQIGDTGTIVATDLATTTGFTFKVTDTKIAEEGLTTHIGIIETGNVILEQSVIATVDDIRRKRIERNHTATHILHKSLSEVLGEHVKQAGSFVAPTHLRFDFTHFEAMTAEQIQEVEDLVNDRIMQSHGVSNYETTLDLARKSGVVALFGEKYGENVRVLECGTFSSELCGGTHVNNTSDIGFFKIMSEASIGSNIRRIEAVTSFDALEYVNRAIAELKEVSSALKAPLFESAEKTKVQQDRLKLLEKDLQATKTKGDSAKASDLLVSENFIEGTYPMLIASVEGHDANDLKSLWDLIKVKFEKPGAAVLASSKDGKASLIAAATDEAVSDGFNAGAVIKECAPLIDGRGGGKANMAQAGGTNIGGIDAALSKAKELLSI